MSYIEDCFAFQIKATELPEPEREYPFAKKQGRRFRADFCWPDKRLIAEIEGGLYTGGRHVRPNGFTADCEKYNLATMLGYRVLRFTPAMVESGQALATVEKMLQEEK